MFVTTDPNNSLIISIIIDAITRGPYSLIVVINFLTYFFLIFNILIFIV